jgi:hypothetical protein
MDRALQNGLRRLVWGLIVGALTFLWLTTALLALQVAAFTTANTIGGHVRLWVPLAVLVTAEAVYFAWTRRRTGGSGLYGFLAGTGIGAAAGILALWQSGPEDPRSPDQREVLSVVLLVWAALLSSAAVGWRAWRG